MSKLLVGADGVTKTIFHEEDGGDACVIEEVQDIEPILKHNRSLQNEEVNPHANMRHAASIPLVVWQEWMKEFRNTRGYEYRSAKQLERLAFVRSKLNDSDNQMFRTWMGKI